MATAKPTSPRSISEILELIRGWVAKAGKAAAHAAVLVNPVPASRPRVGRFGTYYSKTYAKWRKEAERFKLGTKAAVTPLAGPCFAMIEIVVQKAKTSVRSWPIGDWDNFGKAISDLLNEVAWNDDDQIVGAAVFKRFANKDEDPGTYVSWVPVEIA